MAKKKTLLEQMRTNPANDWTIGQVETLCRQHGLNCSRPSSGSHYIVSSPVVDGAQSVPARRPIKTIYIKRLVSLCDAHSEYLALKEGGNE